jgi:hypothetical protein
MLLPLLLLLPLICSKMTVESHQNDSRIFEHPQDRSSSDSEGGFGKEKVVCTFGFTLRDT